MSASRYASGGLEARRARSDSPCSTTSHPGRSAVGRHSQLLDGAQPAHVLPRPLAGLVQKRLDQGIAALSGRLVSRMLAQTGEGQLGGLLFAALLDTGLCDITGPADCRPHLVVLALQGTENHLSV
jgi:hypothetical protein